MILSLTLVQQNVPPPPGHNPYRTSSRGTRCPLQQVHCTVFQASRQSPLTAMLIVEGVVVGFTAFVVGWKTQMSKYGGEVSCFMLTQHVHNLSTLL